MSARIMAGGHKDPGKMLIETVTVEVTSTGGGPIVVALDVKSTTQEYPAKVVKFRGTTKEYPAFILVDDDLGVAPGNVIEDGTFTVHPNQYKSYDIYKADGLRRKSKSTIATLSDNSSFLTTTPTMRSNARRWARWKAT